MYISINHAFSIDYKLLNIYYLYTIGYIKTPIFSILPLRKSIACKCFKLFFYNTDVKYSYNIYLILYM